MSLSFSLCLSLCLSLPLPLSLSFPLSICLSQCLTHSLCQKKLNMCKPLNQVFCSVFHSNVFCRMNILFNFRLSTFSLFAGHPVNLSSGGSGGLNGEVDPVTGMRKLDLCVVCQVCCVVIVENVSAVVVVVWLAKSTVLRAWGGLTYASSVKLCCFCWKW